MSNMRRSFMLLAMALLSITAIAIVEVIPSRHPDPLASTKLRAARLMSQGMRVIRDARLERGLSINPDVDPNATGMIGSEYSEITTTLGPLEVKRTTTNPDFAAAVVQMLWEAGVRKGDMAAAGISGSFPALALALYSAAEVMEVELISMSSVGTSTYGATDPLFTWLDMETALRQSGLFSTHSVAASVGGDNDQLEHPLFPDAAAIARKAIRRNAVVLLSHDTFQDTVTARMDAYRSHAGTNAIAAFVNVGGAEVNLGLCDAGYRLAAGVVASFPSCPETSQGVAYRMADAGVRVINLLNVRALCLRYGLPVDPIPLPVPGTSHIYFQRPSARLPGLVLVGFLVLIGLLIRMDRTLLRR